MKKRLLLAVLLSAAAGGMLYQMSWSEEIPVDAPGQDVEDPEVGTPGFCQVNPFDPACRVPTFVPPPVDAPGAGVDPETGAQIGVCIENPELPECVSEPLPMIPPPDRPVEAPGQELLP